MRGRGLLCREVPSLALPPQETWGVTGDSGGRGGFSERSPSPPRPLSPEERLAFGAGVSAELVPPVRGCVVPYKLCESTAADRAAADVWHWEGEPLRPLCGHLPFQGRLFEGTVYAARSRRLCQPPWTCGAGRANPSARSAGTSPFRGGFLRVLHMLHGRGSVSRRDLNRAYRRPPTLAWVRKSEGRTKPIPSHSSGGGPGEALLLEKRPPPEFSHSLAGRGGSVSRRDLDQAYRRPPTPRMGTQVRKKRTSLFPATLREGGRGRRFS